MGFIFKSKLISKWLNVIKQVKSRVIDIMLVLGWKIGKWLVFNKIWGSYGINKGILGRQGKNNKHQLDSCIFVVNHDRLLLFLVSHILINVINAS